jgi:2-amino-4-hydroxy-6-hydroxymethyldihydropteridine diphosphokinase
MPDPRRDDLDPGIAYLSIGSNMGAREANVLRVATLLDNADTTRGRMSALYETAPEGCPPQQDFVNAVLEVQSLLCAEDLLKRLKVIEKTLGRTGRHNEPREIDIDLVTFGNLVMETEFLTIPHERYRERAFVLVPLRDIAPRFRCPVTERTVDELIEGLRRPQAITRISSRKLVFVDANQPGR